MLKWLLLTCFQENDMDEETKQFEFKSELNDNKQSECTYLDDKLAVLQQTILELKENMEKEKQENLQLKKDIVLLQQNVEELKNGFINAIDDMKELINYYMD